MEQPKLAKHWWAILLRGIIALIFAFLALFATGFTLNLLLLFLGIYLLLEGLLAIIGAFMATSHKNWWILLLEGIVSLGFGIAVLVWPGLTLMVLVYLVALWAVITGLFEFIASVSASWAIPGKAFLGVVGVLSVIVGIIIFINPLISIVLITWLIGIYALVAGLALIFFSLKLKTQ